MSKISQYGTLTEAAAGDLVPVVDVSDTTMALSGTTKKMTLAVLADAIGGGAGGNIDGGSAASGEFPVSGIDGGNAS